MKKWMLLIGVGCGMMFLTGCGKAADENKTPEEIRQEVSAMSAADIKAVVEKYRMAIADKSAEIKAESDKLSKIPLMEQLGEEANQIKGKLADLNGSLKKLQENMDAYLAGLKSAK